MQSGITELFFSLIRCGIGKESRLPRIPDVKEWETLFEISQKQALTGIAYSGISRLPAEQYPPKRVLLAWYTACEQIKEKNIELNKRSVAVSAKFTQAGFRNCILKGQGIAQLYPTPAMRTPGDIDVWLEGGHKRILEYVKRYFPKSAPTYHHVDFPIKKGLEIEVHFTPSWLHSPFANRRLQHFLATNAHKQFGNSTATPDGKFNTPTIAFNRVYILLHIYRHLFQEGVGLRQLLDYYFVIDKGSTQEEKEECARTLYKLGLTDFAAATAYVLQEVFSLEPEKQIIAPHRKRGEFLLNEIMLAGNFGKHDSRYRIVSKENELKHFANSMQRTARLVFQYPSETLWSPFFKIWHFFWRKMHCPRPTQHA